MIHDENPFVDTPDQRDPVRRFRGRLVAPVTVVTAGRGAEQTGLTVSSLNVVEGNLGVAQLVVGPTSDLWDVSKASGAFVIHILGAGDRHLAEVFAGLRPSPGGIFAGLDLTSTEHGPVVDGLANRAYCRFVDRFELGYSGIVTGEIEKVETDGLTNPLTYFRGSYRSLA
jgi:flavin reductase (DIM6/NTAB) family NADH-FMN oxidoreductase RutF